MGGLSSGPGPGIWLFALLLILIQHAQSAPVYDEDEGQQTHIQEYYDGNAEAAGCYYNFQHYDEGDRIITNEPCLNCTCHNRMLMCYLRVCPFTKAIGQDCTVEKKADQCCPVITCPEVPVQLLTSSTTTEGSPEVPQIGSGQQQTAVGSLDDFGCRINDLFYTDGAQVPANSDKPCELCYCIRNRTACVMQECTLKVEGCRPIYEDGVCCPVRYQCDYEEDSRDVTTERPQPTPGLVLTTTTPGPLDCRHDNQLYADGASIETEEPCEHCYCMKGEIVCAVQECGTPLEKEGQNCTALPPPPGKCCPESYQCDHNEVEDEMETSFRQDRKHNHDHARIEPNANVTTVTEEPTSPITESTKESIIEEATESQPTQSSSTSQEQVPESDKPLHVNEIPNRVEEEHTAVTDKVEETATPVKGVKGEENGITAFDSHTTESVHAVSSTEDSSRPEAEDEKDVQVTTQASSEDQMQVTEGISHSQKPLESDSHVMIVEKDEEKRPEVEESPEVSSSRPDVPETVSEQVTERVTEAEQAVVTYATEIEEVSPTHVVTEGDKKVESTTQIISHDVVHHDTENEEVTEESPEAPAEHSLSTSSEETILPEATTHRSEVEHITEHVMEQISLSANPESSSESSKDQATVPTIEQHFQSVTDTPEIQTERYQPSEEAVSTPAGEESPVEVNTQTVHRDHADIPETTELTPVIEEHEEASKPGITETSSLEVTSSTNIRDEIPGFGEVTEIAPENSETEVPEVSANTEVPEVPTEAPHSSIESSSQEVDTPGEAITPIAPIVPNESTESQPLEMETDPPSQDTQTVEPVRNDIHHQVTEIPVILDEASSATSEAEHDVTLVDETHSSTENIAQVSSESPKEEISLELEGTTVEPQVVTTNVPDAGINQDGLSSHAGSEEESVNTPENIQEIVTTEKLEDDQQSPVTLPQEENLPSFIDNQTPSVQETRPSQTPEVIHDFGGDEDHDIEEHPPAEMVATTERVVEQEVTNRVDVPTADVSEPDHSFEPMEQSPEIIPEDVKKPEQMVVETTVSPVLEAENPTDAPSETERSPEDEDQQHVTPVAESINEVQPIEDKIPESPVPVVSQEETPVVTTIAPSELEEDKSQTTVLPEVIPAENVPHHKPPSEAEKDEAENEISAPGPSDTEAEKVHPVESLTEEPLEQASHENVIPTDEEKLQVPHIVHDNNVHSTETPIRTTVASEEAAVTTLPNVVPGEGSCLLDGRTYLNNSVIAPASPCQTSCRCVSSIVHCILVQCPPAPEEFAHCSPVHHESTCCPTYTCDGETSPSLESESHLAGTEPSFIPETSSANSNDVPVTESVKFDHTEIASTNAISQHEENTDAPIHELSPSQESDSIPTSENELTPEEKPVVPEVYQTERIETEKKPEDIQEEHTVTGTEPAVVEHSTEPQPDEPSTEFIQPIEEEKPASFSEEPETAEQVTERIEEGAKEPEKDEHHQQKPTPEPDQIPQGTPQSISDEISTEIPSSEIVSPTLPDASSENQASSEEPETISATLPESSSENEIHEVVTDSNIRATSLPETVTHPEVASSSEEVPAVLPEETSVGTEIPVVSEEQTKTPSELEKIEFTTTFEKPIKYPSESSIEVSSHETTSGEVTEESLSEHKPEESFSPEPETSTAVISGSESESTESFSIAELHKSSTHTPPVDSTPESTESIVDSTKRISEVVDVESSTPASLNVDVEQPVQPVESDEHKEVSAPDLISVSPVTDVSEDIRPTESHTEITIQQDVTTKAHPELVVITEVAHAAPEKPSEDNLLSHTEFPVMGTSPVDIDGPVFTESSTFSHVTETSSEEAQSSVETETETVRPVTPIGVHKPNEDVAVTSQPADLSSTEATQTISVDTERNIVDDVPEATPTPSESSLPGSEEQSTEVGTKVEVPEVSSTELEVSSSTETVHSSEHSTAGTTISESSSAASEEPAEVPKVEVTTSQPEITSSPASNEEPATVTSDEPNVPEVLAETSPSSVQSTESPTHVENVDIVSTAAPEIQVLTEEVSAVPEVPVSVSTTSEPERVHTESTTLALILEVPEATSTQKPINEHEQASSTTAPEAVDAGKPEFSSESPEDEYNNQKPVGSFEENESEGYDYQKPDGTFPEKPSRPQESYEPIEEEHPIPGEYVPSEDEYDDEQEQPYGPGTCRYAGKVYVSAQQIPRDDPCDFCFCFRSDIICLQQSCPPPIPGCHEEPISGFCCPRYECHVRMATLLNVTSTTTTTTTTLPPHFLSHAYKGTAARMGCFVQGRAYKVGQAIASASGPCMDCICGGDGRMKCEPKICTPEPMIRKMMVKPGSSTSLKQR